MKGRTLTVTVDRPFRTDEEPQVAMRLRNTPRLRMKAYKIDPEEYVARKGGLGGAPRGGSGLARRVSETTTR